MYQIEDIEKHLASKRKALLASLRENNWKVLHVDDENSDWAFDQKWLIESIKENYGFSLELWFFKYSGKHDGMDRVIAKSASSSVPNAYSGQPSIEFDGRKFDNQLKSFLESLHLMRIESTKEK